MQNQNIHQLASLGYVTIQYPANLRQAVEEAVASWKSFCALPDSMKRALPYSNGADGVGYECKDGIGPRADRKENFDVTTAGQDWLDRNLAGVTSPEVSSFLQRSIALNELIRPVAIDFARQVETAYGVQGLAAEVEQGEGNFFTRFIHYFGDRAVGEETATAHTDQSGFTLHLFENAPGFELLSQQGEWMPMNFSAGETLIIPSMQLQLRSEGKLKATCHRVVATPETAAGGRFSAVCFVQLRNTPKYDKDRHGRLQEKKPGFNYPMGHEEFARLFKA